MPCRTLIAAAFLCAFVGTALRAAAESNVLPNAFFAMDTGLRDGKHPTPADRAETLALLGYPGGDLTGGASVPGILQAYDAKGLKLFAIYTGLNIDSPDVPAGLAKAIGQLKGRDTVLWIPVQSRKYKKSDPAGDEQAAALLRKAADLAAAAGLRIALYPHTGFWVEKVEDAVRVAKKADRPNVGATFNLCHFLQCDDEKNLEKALAGAASHLFVVTVSGADRGAKGWGRLIQTLDKGTFDQRRVLRKLRELNYLGPIGLQGYGIKGDSRENLRASMSAWRKLAGELGGRRTAFLTRTSADFGAFRGETGDWTIAGEVSRDPKDAKRLAWKDGRGAAVNGPKGRTRHLVTKHEHGDCVAHIEFVVPKGSNSGVYFQGRYEIQVFDSWGVEKPTHGDCGGIYQRWDKGRGYEGRPPRVNASREPGAWQSFDAIFRAPRFDASGNKIANACFVKILHNGILVHENAELTGPTRAAAFRDEKPLGPILFQGDHGPVAYRNCWIVEYPPPAK